MKNIVNWDVVVDPESIVIGYLSDIPAVVWILGIVVIVCLLVFLTKKLTKKH